MSKTLVCTFTASHTHLNSHRWSICVRRWAWRSLTTCTEASSPRRYLKLDAVCFSATALIHPHLLYYRVDLDVNGASWRLRASYRSCSMPQVFGGAFHIGFNGEFRRTQSRRASGPRGKARAQPLLGTIWAARHVTADAERAARGARVSRAFRVHPKWPAVYCVTSKRTFSHVQSM